MSLRPGTSLGHYEILALLGAGGMGEVYRARDTRLGRDVALKILPEAFVNDPERLARFQREAKTLASLNHPHIAQVHGFEEIGTTRALVLELVEGEDLAQRLAHGAMPMDDALPIARQIAEAIEVAHEAGIVHRDLKPANITVRHDGQVKVLDFGLAKAMEPPGSPVADPALSPTLTSPATLQGALLGTAAYMAPEQARGKPVDKRADIWAFGVVLYEMLTGTRAFPGANGTEVLAAVLRDTPDLTALPADTPSSVRHLLARCLERDPSRRLRDIGEARIALEERAGSEPSVAVGATREASSRRSRLSAFPRARGVERLALWSLAAVAAASVTVAAWAVFGRGNTAVTSTLEVQRFDVAFPRDIEPSPATEGGIAVSPDGRIVAMTAWKRGVRTVFVRRLDSEDTRRDSGIERGGIRVLSRQHADRVLRRRPAPFVLARGRRGENPDLWCGGRRRTGVGRDGGRLRAGARRCGLSRERVEKPGDSRLSTPSAARLAHRAGHPARWTDRAVLDLHARARRRAYRGGADVGGTAQRGARARQVARVVADGPPALHSQRRGARRAVRCAHGDRDRHANARLPCRPDRRRIQRDDGLARGAQRHAGVCPIGLPGAGSCRWRVTGPRSRWTCHQATSRHRACRPIGGGCW